MSYFKELFLVMIVFTNVLASSPANVQKKLSILTYNIWFDKQTSKIRIPRILELFDSYKPDVIALQEVEPWFLKAIRDDIRFRGYLFYYERKRDASIKGGVLLLTKKSAFKNHYLPLPSNMQRGFLFLELAFKKEKLCLINSHLDSMLNDQELRTKQLLLIQKKVSRCNNILWLGDFNFGDDGVENDFIEKRFKDVWLLLKPHQKGFTWDKEYSYLAKENSFLLEKSRRLDRIFVSGKLLKAKNIEIVGNKSFTTSHGIKLFPSDHFALLAYFLIQND